MKRLFYIFFLFFTYKFSIESDVPKEEFSEPVPEDPIIVNDLIFGKPPEEEDPNEQKKQLMLFKKKAAAKKKAQSQREDMMIQKIEKTFIKKILDSIKKTFLKNAGLILKIMVLIIMILLVSFFYNYNKWEEFKSFGLLK